MSRESVWYAAASRISAPGALSHEVLQRPVERVETGPPFTYVERLGQIHSREQDTPPREFTHEVEARGCGAERHMTIVVPDQTVP